MGKGEEIDEEEEGIAERGIEEMRVEKKVERNSERSGWGKVEGRERGIEKWRE